MKDIRYVGPHDAVDVEQPSTPFGTCGRGKTITVPDDVAESLLEQGPDHWQPATTTKPKEA